MNLLIWLPTLLNFWAIVNGSSEDESGFDVFGISDSSSSSDEKVSGRNVLAPKPKVALEFALKVLNNAERQRYTPRPPHSSYEEVTPGPPNYAEGYTKTFYTKYWYPGYSLKSSVVIPYSTTSKIWPAYSNEETWSTKGSKSSALWGNPKSKNPYPQQPSRKPGPKNSKKSSKFWSQKWTPYPKVNQDYE